MQLNVLGTNNLGTNNVLHGDEVLGVVELTSSTFHGGVDSANLAGLSGLHLHNDGRNGPVSVLAVDINVEAGHHEGLTTNEGDLRGADEASTRALKAGGNEGGRIINGETHNDVLSTLNNCDRFLTGDHLRLVVDAYLVLLAGLHGIGGGNRHGVGLATSLVEVHGGTVGTAAGLNGLVYGSG